MKGRFEAWKEGRWSACIVVGMGIEDGVVSDLVILNHLGMFGV